MATLASGMVRPLPDAQAGHNAGTPSLLSTFQAHVEDMRNLVLCKICIRPLYEPYTLGCGHTYCYSCLTSWFGGGPNRKKRKNCPDCRATVSVQPSPNYLLRDLVHMFISRTELLPEDETTAEHDEAKRIEAELIENDRNTSPNEEPGLFKGAFCRGRVQFQGPIRDEEDGVLRCPMCAWEMEDGECGQCGYADYEPEFHDDEDHEDDTIDSQSVVSIHSSNMDGEDIDVEDIIRPWIQGQPPDMQDDFRQWVRRDEAARRARRAARHHARGHRAESASTAEVEAIDRAMMAHHYDQEDYDIDGEEDDEEMAAFLEHHPHDNHRWDADLGEHMDEDEEMTSTIDEEDAASTTSFHRAAILARDRGLNPPFESDLSTNASEGEGDGGTVTNDSSSSDVSTDSDEDSDTPAPVSAVQRLASRPARIVIDSDDDSDSDGHSSSGDEGTENDTVNGDEDEDSDSSESEPTPPPPRPAAVRQARVQMHRGRRGDRGAGRGAGGGRGRGRPRMRN